MSHTPAATAKTASQRMASLPDPPQQPLQQGLLGVHAVAGLLEGDALLAVEHLAGHLLAAVRRQAVHEAGLRRSLGHQRRVDLEALERLDTLLVLGLLAHARPD